MSAWTPEDDKEALSYADIHGEWEQRKISLWGAARAFITQLRVGQDMTKMSIPAIFLRPYSILEEIATRSMAKVHLLFDVPRRKDPMDRLMGVVAWLICSGQAENFNHKPYNPVLGEEHKAWINYDDGSTCYCICEQVEHHPPAAAFVVHNPTHGVTIDANFIFDVTFHGNSVTIRTLGGMRIILDTEDGPEEYNLEKGMPDLLVKNVILGTKYVFWTGDMDFDCPKTKCKAHLSFGYVGSENTISGALSQNDEVKVELEGVTGFETWRKTEGKKKKKDKGVLFCDPREHTSRKPQYNLWKDLPEHSSLKKWHNVSDAIIEYDLATADMYKNEIEEAQREKARQREAGTLEPHVPVYFSRVDNGPVPNFWEIKDREFYKKWMIKGPE